jgi:drug/metabolite transporter (DMT)-like permease
MTERKPLDSNAFALMVLLTALWGVQPVIIKLVANDVTPLMQAGIRSIVATVLVLAWAAHQRISVWRRDGTLWAGIFAGLLFCGEFVFIYAGLEHTAASRMVVFIYLAPVLTALGLHWLVPGERLVPGQWAGVLLSFAGVVLAFWEGLDARGNTWLGDLCGVIAAVFWAATTVLIRATSLARATATKTLFYQLGVSALILPLASIAMGEKGVVALTPLALASLAYQGVIVARLSVFSFLSPMFGVLAGVIVLGEPLRPLFAAAAGLVVAGIVLVNLRER